MKRPSLSSQAPELCYMCGRPATSREHVPPRSIFPEGKDLDGKDHRRNLVTVPSCRIHNSEKSSDDEFLMVSLAGIIGNNSIGYMHKFSKVNRAIRRSANRLLIDVFAERKLFIIRDENKFLDVIWGKPDFDRLNRCFDRIARGIHLHHFRTRYLGEIVIYLGYLRHSDSSSRNFSAFIRDKVGIEMSYSEKFGKNDDIFFYQVSPVDQYGLFTFRMCFYGGLDIYAAFVPDRNKLPYHLGFDLMNKGIKTIITIGETKYEIN